MTKICQAYLGGRNQNLPPPPKHIIFPLFSFTVKISDLLFSPEKPEAPSALVAFWK